MKKLFILLFILILFLSGCANTQPISNNSESDNINVNNNDVTTEEVVRHYPDTIFLSNGYINIRHAESESDESLFMENVIFKGHDANYLIPIKERVNYSNQNNYVIGEYTYVALVDNVTEYGINEDHGMYTFVQKLSDNDAVIISSKCEEDILTLLANIYTVDDIYYHIFDHEINPEWTKEVKLTGDIFYLYNGESDAYIFRDNNICVFLEPLDIDFPATYPDDIDNVPAKLRQAKGEGLYTPGYREYTPYRIDGYIPFSIYSNNYSYRYINSYGNEYNKKVDWKHYFLLTGNTENFYSLFGLYETRSDKLELNISNNNLSKVEFDNSICEINNIRYLVNDIKKSDNQFPKGQDSYLFESDAYNYFVAHGGNSSIIKFHSNFYAPTINMYKYVYENFCDDSQFENYDRSMVSGENYAIWQKEGGGTKNPINTISAHVNSGTIRDIDFTKVGFGYNMMKKIEYLKPGDFVYLYYESGKLNVYEVIEVNIYAIDGSNWSGDENSQNAYAKSIGSDLVLYTCSSSIFTDENMNPTNVFLRNLNK